MRYQLSFTVDALQSGYKCFDGLRCERLEASTAENTIIYCSVKRV